MTSEIEIWMVQFEIFMTENIEILSDDVLIQIRLIIIPYLAVHGKLPDSEGDKGRVGEAIEFYVEKIVPSIGLFPSPVVLES